MNSLRINSLDNYKKNDEIVDVVFDEEMFFENMLAERRIDEDEEVIDEKAEFKAAYCENLF